MRQQKTKPKPSSVSLIDVVASFERSSPFHRLIASECAAATPVCCFWL